MRYGRKGSGKRPATEACRQNRTERHGLSLRFLSRQMHPATGRPPRPAPEGLGLALRDEYLRIGASGAHPRALLNTKCERRGSLLSARQRQYATMDSGIESWEPAARAGEGSAGSREAAAGGATAAAAAAAAADGAGRNLAGDVGGAAFGALEVAVGFRHPAELLVQAAAFRAAVFVHRHGYLQFTGCGGLVRGDNAQTGH